MPEETLDEKLERRISEGEGKPGVPSDPMGRPVEASILDPRNNRMVFMILLIDMDENVRDVIGTLYLCAPDGPEAFKRAQFAFQQQGLIPEGKKVHFHAVALGPLPGTVITPTSRVIRAS
jgi:hypothetical protein